MSSTQPFTGHNRQRRTTRMVRAADKLAHGMIVGGGLGTIVAVLLVSVFLIWVVAPLFWPSSMAPIAEVKPPWSGPTWRLGVDEHQLSGWQLTEGGKLRHFRLDPGHEGEVLAERSLTPAERPAVTAFARLGDEVAIGFADGSLQVGDLSFVATYLDPQNADARSNSLAPGGVLADSEGLVIRTAEGQLRRQSLTIDLGAPTTIAEDRAIVALDFTRRAGGLLICAQLDDGSLRLGSLKQIRNLETDEVTYRARFVELSYLEADDRSAPRYLRLSGAGDNAFAIWPNGRLLRFDLRDPANPQVAEELNVLAEPDRTVTAVEFAIGKSTLVIGDSAGGVRGWFRVNRPDAATTDASAFVAAHDLPATGSAVTSLAPSSRTRMMAAGYADGGVRLFYLTTDSLLIHQTTEGNASVTNLVMAPKDDGVLTLSSAALSLWRLNAQHPEVSLTALFRPVWYEGSDAPSHVWQSSSGTDDFEPKLGLAPLIFGTIKATFYSLLVAVPLALLAAVYSSEFLRRGARAKIKPAIELMASLPSVVLGFIAALVLAPLVEELICGVLAAMLCVPLTLLLGAYLWQLLPSSARVEWAKVRFACMCLLLPLGVFAGVRLGPTLERWLFAGNVKAWLQGGVGSAMGGWWAMLLPCMAALAAWLLAAWVNPWIRVFFAGRPPFHAALADLCKFLIAVISTVAAAGAASWLLTAAGFDPRGSLLDTYEQRNALVVGFVMGFAIIPIINTISEDALSSVPEHLRSASLGAGATEWQTAVRIVIPTAMSGLFSAVMIGLGRAVGETMIVLMAAGNTPVMSWNVFNGFRTLSANIAVELPEAVRDSTHYRTLFLAALVLFALTFILNTAAEAIRQRFRKRAFQL